MRRIVLTYGFIAGAILSAMMVAVLPFQDQIGFEHGATIGYATMVLAFLMVFAAVKTYRDAAPGGRVSFGKAFQVGLLVTLIATACYVVTWQVVSRAFMPDFMDKYAAYSLAQAREAGASAEELARQEREMAEFAELYKNPLVNIAFTTIEPLPIGLVFTLVSAGVLSRKRE